MAAEVEAVRMKLNQLEADTCAEYIRFEVAPPAPVESIKMDEDESDSESESELSSPSVHDKEKSESGFFTFLSDTILILVWEMRCSAVMKTK